ncbi:MAG: S24 family peptidase [Rhizobiaceae bacterium]
MKEKGISASKASMLAVGNPSMIKNMRLGQNPSFLAIEKLFVVLEIGMHFGLRVPEPESLSTVELIGMAGAGGSVAYDGHLHDGETAPAPPGDIRSIVAIEVRGDSAVPFLRDGDRVYIRPNQPANPTHHIGRLVLATTTDGAAYIKILRRGDDNNYWNLESINPHYPMMENIELDRISPFVWIHFKQP